MSTTSRADLLALRASESGRLTMAAISYVFTIGRIAEMLGENEDWLQEISIEMDPKHNAFSRVRWLQRASATKRFKGLVGSRCGRLGHRQTPPSPSFSRLPSD